MAGPAYLKIWTTVLHNSKLLPLTLSERGFYLWLLVMCKEQRDDGQVFCRSWAALGQNCGCDLRTARKITGKLSQACLLNYRVDDGGLIVIEIPNYKEWQELEVKEVLQKTRQNAETVHSTTQTPQQQSRAEQSREEKSITANKSPSLSYSKKKKEKTEHSDHKKFVTFWNDGYNNEFHSDYPWTPKDFKGIQRMLKIKGMHVEALQELAMLFWKQDDQFVVSAGHTVGIFSTRLAALQEQALKPHESEEDPDGLPPREQPTRSTSS